MIIAFYGVDGSGKTTQIKLLIEELKLIDSAKVRLFHFRPTFLYKIPSEVVKSNPHNQPNTNYLRSVIKLVYYIFMYNWGFLTQILLLNMKKDFVLFDRYYFDILIDPKRYRLDASKWLIEFCGKFIPKPDINICLIADAELIHKRKPEIGINELDRQQKTINEIFTKTNDYILRTDMQITNTFNEINKIVQDIVKREN